MSGTATHPLDDEDRIDDTVEDSFPASDPLANTPTAGAVAPHGDEAKGTPHSDRHATETAAGRHEGNEPAERKSE
jgi:hypothetical protein